jgi:hypothetical protein
MSKPQSSVPKIDPNIRVGMVVKCFQCTEDFKVEKAEETIGICNHCITNVYIPADETQLDEGVNEDDGDVSESEQEFSPSNLSWSPPDYDDDGDVGNLAQHFPSQNSPSSQLTPIVSRQVCDCIKMKIQVAFSVDNLLLYLVVVYVIWVFHGSNLHSQ